MALPHPRRKRSEHSRKIITTTRGSPFISNHPRDNKKGGNGGDSDSDDDPEKDARKKALDSAIVADKPNVRWEDIAGLDVAKGALKETVILPVRFPHLFQGTRLTAIHVRTVLRFLSNMPFPMICCLLKSQFSDFGRKPWTNIYM